MWVGPIFKSHIKHVLSGFALIGYNGKILPAECGEKSAFDSFDNVMSWQNAPLTWAVRHSGQ